MANPTGVLKANLQTLSVQMDTDLTDKEGYFVNFDTTDDNVVNIAAAALLVPYILEEGKLGTATAPKTGSIAQSGRTKLIIAATVQAGQPLMPDGNGKGIVAIDGKYYGAIALENGVSGDIIAVDVCRGVWKTVS